MFSSNLRLACPLRVGAVLLSLFGLAACAGKPKTQGERLYGNLCVSCHQSDGAGAKGLYPPLAGTPVPTGDPAVMVAWVLYGVRPAALPRGVYAGVMPQFNYLSDADAAAVVTYVRTSFGNNASPVAAADVAAVRTRYAAP